jgi:hypothetical protein
MPTNPFETKPQVIGGAFTAENCILDLGTKVASDGAVVQRVNFTINRPINFVYEIGGSTGGTGASSAQNVYYVGGRRQGQATFERIVTGSQVFKKFIDGYGPLCGAIGDDIKLTAKGACVINRGTAAGAAPGAASPAPVTTGGVIYTLKTPKLTTVGASVSAQDIVIMESLGMVFLDLEYQAINAAGAAI